MNTLRTFSSADPLQGYDKTQIELMKEQLILVNDQDEQIGEISKKEGHLRSYLDQEEAVPHRAFSLFLMNEKNELLLQRRSADKITFPSMWTNTCCSHPLNTPSETEGPVKGAKLAVVRRCAYELNMKGLDVDDLNLITKILYRANTDEIWAEYELDHIYFAKKHTDEIEYSLNKNEVSDIQFVSKTNILDFLNDEIKRGRGQITPWFKLILHTKLFDWWDLIEQTGKIPEEDTSGEIIDYIKGENAVDMDQFVNVSSTLDHIKRNPKGARAFSTRLNKANRMTRIENLEALKNRIGMRSFSTKLDNKEQFYTEQVKDPSDKCASQFGEKDLLTQTNLESLTRIGDIDESMEGKEVTIRARVHNIRAKGGSCFMICRESSQQVSTVQCALFTSTTSKGMINYVKRIPNESIVEIKGKVVRPEQDIKSCTQDVELMVSEVWVLDKADFRLPIQIDDISRAISQSGALDNTVNVCSSII